MFKVFWLGYGGNSWQADQYRDELRIAGIRLITCHEHPNADIQYDWERIHEFIDSADAVMLPVRQHVQPAKSVNRLAMAWSRRKPVVVGPGLPAYERVVEEGSNALVARSREDWVRHLTTIRDDQALREKLAANGLATAKKHFDPKMLHQHFFTSIRQAAKHRPLFVQIIIPHYSNRTDYVRWAVKSSLEALGPDRDVFLVSSAAESPEAALQEFKKYPNFRVEHSKERLSFSAANNIGIRKADPRTTHFLLLNDDAVLAKDALVRMFEALGDEEVVLNPYSNCDQGWLHHDRIVVVNPDRLGKELHPGMHMEHLEPWMDAIQNHQVPTSPALLDAPFCAMYATLIPKSIQEKVGLLNETFLNGGEDADYSYRVHRYGFRTCWTKNAFVFHFGGKTRKFSEDSDYNRHHEEDRYNNGWLKRRWSGKKRVGIWTGPAWELWDLHSYLRPVPKEAGGVGRAGIGGSETCAARLAMEFEKDGNYVLMMGEHRKESVGNIDLIPWNTYHPEQEYFDLFIASRNLNCIDERLKAKKVVAWIHDIFLLSNREPNNRISEFHINRVDYFIALCPWHVEFLVQYHQNIPREKIIIIPNGVNTELFDAL